MCAAFVDQPDLLVRQCALVETTMRLELWAKLRGVLNCADGNGDGRSPLGVRALPDNQRSLKCEHSNEDEPHAWESLPEIARSCPDRSTVSGPD